MAAAGVSEPMSEDAVTIINMEDMAVVFSVTDDFGIHRESVSVDLAREDPGEVSVDGGKVEITLPASRTPEDFASTIRTELEAQGYSHNPGQVVTNDGEGGDDEEGEDDWLA